LVKIAPDVSQEQLQDIAQVALEMRVDGVIVSNTTISRPASIAQEQEAAQAGGLSGPPLKHMTLRTLKTLYQLTRGRVLLIGCGGIETGKDAVEFARSGATLVEVLTGMIYHGPGFPRQLKEEILSELNGQKWKDVVGSDVQQ